MSASKALDSSEVDEFGEKRAKSGEKKGRWTRNPRLRTQGAGLYHLQWSASHSRKPFFGATPVVQTGGETVQSIAHAARTAADFRDDSMAIGWPAAVVERSPSDRSLLVATSRAADSPARQSMKILRSSAMMPIDLSDPPGPFAQFAKGHDGLSSYPQGSTP